MFLIKNRKPTKILSAIEYMEKERKDFERKQLLKRIATIMGSGLITGIFCYVLFNVIIGPGAGIFLGPPFGLMAMINCYYHPSDSISG